jgi:hypothetical protein
MALYIPLLLCIHSAFVNCLLHSIFVVNVVATSFYLPSLATNQIHKKAILHSTRRQHTRLGAQVLSYHVHTFVLRSLDIYSASSAAALRSVGGDYLLGVP